MAGGGGIHRTARGPREPCPRRRGGPAAPRGRDRPPPCTVRWLRRGTRERVSVPSQTRSAPCWRVRRRRTGGAARLVHGAPSARRGRRVATRTRRALVAAAGGNGTAAASPVRPWVRRAHKEARPDSAFSLHGIGSLSPHDVGACGGASHAEPPRHEPWCRWPLPCFSRTRPPAAGRSPQRPLAFQRRGGPPCRPWLIRSALVVVQPRLPLQARGRSETIAVDHEPKSEDSRSNDHLSNLSYALPMALPCRRQKLPESPAPPIRLHSTVGVGLVQRAAPRRHHNVFASTQGGSTRSESGGSALV